MPSVSVTRHNLSSPPRPSLSDAENNAPHRLRRVCQARHRTAGRARNAPLTGTRFAGRDASAPGSSDDTLDVIRPGGIGCPGTGSVR